MRVLIIGATGTIGSAVADAFTATGDEVLRASRNSDLAVDISDPAAIAAMYQKVGETIGRLDAVVCCAGAGAFAPLTELSDEQLEFTVRNKLLGQVNVVRHGVEYVNDGGVFVLTSGMFSYRPMPGVPALALANGALESFARAAALDLPRYIRIGTICPPFITETAQKLGMPIEGTLSAAENAKAYLAFASGDETGTVVFVGKK